MIVRHPTAHDGGYPKGLRISHLVFKKIYSSLRKNVSTKFRNALKLILFVFGAANIVNNAKRGQLAFS